jgi:hypothetical protein
VSNFSVAPFLRLQVPVLGRKRKLLEGVEESTEAMNSGGT